MLPEHLPRYPSPAKLNLDLRIIGKRADGYHLLESIFVLIDLYDELCITSRDDGQIILHTPTQGVASDDDLTVRAAKALKNHSGSLKGADIWLKKQIPMGGGLGGGSSNAATVLLVLNQLWQCGLSQAQLIDLGVKLGADVPFFIFGQSAFAQGIGEKLQPIDIPEQYYVLVRPDEHVATPKVFAHPDLPRNSLPCPNPSYVNLQPFRNDMQAIVLKLYPKVAKVYETLSMHGKAQMTGSGACLFLPTESRAQADDIRCRLPESWQAWTVSLLPKHPLFNMISNT